MHIAYAGVSPDPQSPPWAPGMGGTAAPAGTLAGAPAGGLDFLAALLAQAAMPEGKARAPIHHDARAPLIGLAQALTSADASSPSLSRAQSGDVAHAPTIPADEIVLDPPSAARVEEKRALLAGALAILPAPWTVPAFPAPLSAAPASEAATPYVEVSARAKLLALIAMAQGTAPSVALAAGPEGGRFAQTNPLSHPMVSTAPDLEQGRAVLPQPSGLPEIRVPLPAKLSAAVASQPPPEIPPLSSASSVSSEASGRPAAPTMPAGSTPIAAQATPVVPATSAPTTAAATLSPVTVPTTVQATPVAPATSAPTTAAATLSPVTVPTTVQATPVAPATSAPIATAATPVRSPQPALRETLADDLVDALAPQGVTWPSLPPGEHVILEPAPARLQAMASDAKLERGARALRPFLQQASAPAESVVPAVEDVPSRTSPQVSDPAPAIRSAADGREHILSELDPAAIASGAVETSTDASRFLPDQAITWSADLRSQRAQATYPAAALVVPALRQDAPPVPSSATAASPARSWLPGDERSQAGPAFTALAAQNMRSAAEGPVVSDLASQGDDFAAPAVDAPTLSSPADAGRLVKVEPASIGVERSLHPASLLMDRAVEVAPAASGSQSAGGKPAPIGAGQSSLPASIDLGPDQAAEVTAASAGSRPEALAAARADIVASNGPRRAGEGVQLAGMPDPSRGTTDPMLAPDVARPAIVGVIATVSADPALVDEVASPDFAVTMVDVSRADGEVQPGPTSSVREQALPEGRMMYGPTGADRPDRREPVQAAVADGSVAGSIRKEEQPLPGPIAPAHQPTREAVAARAPVSVAQRLAWEAYGGSQGEPFALTRTVAPAAQTVAAPTVAQRWPASPQEGDQQPDPLPVASPAHPIASSSTGGPELAASWHPAPGLMQSAVRGEYESSPLRRAPERSASADVRPEAPLPPNVADLAPVSASTGDRVSGRPPAQPADKSMPSEVSTQPSIAGVVSVPTPREGPSIVAETAADPALEAEASEGFRELIDRIQIAVRRGESTWKLQLRPPSLGRLEVHLTTGAKGLEIVMRTETAEAQAFLQANLPELSRGLDQRGVVIERCEVSCGQPGADLPGAPGEDRQQAGAAWQFAQPAVPLPVSAARRNVAPTTNRAHAQSRSLVDLQA